MQAEYANQTKAILAALDSMPHVKTIYFNPKDGYLVEWHISPRKGFQAISVDDLRADLERLGTSVPAPDSENNSTEDEGSGDGEGVETGDADKEKKKKAR